MIPGHNLTSITSWNPETKAVSLPARCSGAERLSLCPARPQQVFLIHQSASVLLTVIGVIREPGKADDIQKCRDEGHLQQTSAFQISSTEISSDMLLNVLLYNPTEAQREQTSFLFAPAFVIWCICFFIVQYRKSCLRRSFKYLMQTICVSCLHAARCRKNSPIFCLNSKQVDNNRSWGEKAKWEVIGAAKLPFIGKFGTDSSCSFSTGLFNNYSFTIMTIRPASSDSVKYLDF